MSSVLIAGVASIMLSLAALPPLDEASAASDGKGGIVHHPQGASHRLAEPVEKADRHEGAPDRHACTTTRMADPAKPTRCPAAPTRRNR
jgi:hypothetical protein